MTRIRKRPSITTSSLKQEAHATNNGGLLHLGAGLTSNPSFQDTRQSLLCPVSWVKKDPLLLATVANSSGNGDFSAEESKKKLPVTPAALVYYSKPYFAVPSGNSRRGNQERLRTKVGLRETKLRDMDVPQHGGRQKHIHDDGDNETFSIGEKVTIESGLVANRAFYEGQGAGRSETACIERAIKHGSVQSINELQLCADPTDTEDGPSEHPRKVLPLELILNSESRVNAAAKARSISGKEPPTAADYERMMPSSCNTFVSCRTPRLNGKPHDKEWDGVAAEQRVSPLQKAQPLSFMKTDSECTDVKIRGESKSTREERASSDQSLDWPLSSWQGYRRARSFLQGGRLANYPPSNTKFNAPHENLKSSRNFKEVKIYPIEKNTCQQLTKKRPLHITTVESLPHKLNPLSAAGDGSKKQKRHTAAAQENDELAQYSVSAAESSDHVIIRADFMRCRRKDGRRWRCKDQVVKPGAPFCHYHTLKMREKHATSLARRLAKRQSERDARRNGELTRSGFVGRKRRHNLLKIPALQDGYGGGMQESTVREDEGDKDDAEQELEQESEEEASSDGGCDEQVAVKQGLESLNSRWRKKCKPCIRRLHDIQDRPRPALRDGLDYRASSSVWVVHTAPPEISSLRPPPSPLPECQLNTDPYEWRSDFP